MSIGRNDPCPCGSGKKYKNCCGATPDARLIRLYNRIKACNKPYLFDEALSQFDRAMDLSITSNALSLIKSILFSTDAAITSALCLRNILESRALIAMKAAGDIPQDKLELFDYQPALIEYDVYYGDKSLRATKCLDNERLEKEYAIAERAFSLVVDNYKKKLKKLLRSYLPFLCDGSVKFEEIIREYLGDEQSAAYDYLSCIIHPFIKKRGKQKQRDKQKLNAIQTATLKYLDERYGDIRIEQDDIDCVAQVDGETCTREVERLEQLQHEFLNLITKLRSLPQSFMSENPATMLNEIALALFDMRFDYTFGLGEIVLSKFRAFLELIAYFYKVLAGSQNVVDKSYTKLIEEYLSKVCGDTGMKELGTDNPIDYKAKDYFKLLYRISNSVSHGNGYLYYTFLDAVRYQDDVIGFTDRAVRTLLIDLRDLFDKYCDTATASLFDKAYFMLNALDS